MTDVLAETLTNGGIFILRTWMRYAVVCGGAFVVFWVLLAKPLEHRRCQPKKVERKILLKEVLTSLSGSIFFLLPVTLSIPLYHAGYLKVDFEAAPDPLGWMVLSFFLFIVGADAWFYWVHRFMHDSRVYAWTHKLHHLSDNPSPLASYSFSLIEGVGIGLYLPIVLLTVPINVWVVTAFVVFFILMEAYTHLGYELLPAGFASNRITKWLGTSVFHNMHHEDGAYNFSIYFTWWDRMMGTMHPEYEARFDQITRRPLLSSFRKA